MAEQKRKRSSTKEDRPSKKVALEPPQRPSTVKPSFLSSSDEWSPIVASTPGLAIPAALRFRPFKKARPNNHPQQSRQRASAESSELLLHSDSHPKIDYTGREEGRGSSNGLLNHYIGIYDPQIGSLEVVEARDVTIRGTVRAEEEREIVGEEPGDTTNLSRRQELGRAFGTKKAQKAIASLTENSIKSPRKPQDLTSSSATANGATSHRTPPPMSDPAAAAMLQSIAESTKDMASREQLQTNADEGKPRPPANLETPIPEDVYPLETLVGEEELKALPVKDWLLAVEQGEAVKTKSLFVSRRIQKIASSGDVQKLKVLRFLLLLLDFFSSLKPSKLKTEKKLPDRDDLRTVLGVPEALLDSVRRRFSAKATLNKWHIDNLLTNIAAVALHVDDGFDLGVDVYDLREDLRLETRDLTRYFQEIGCKVSHLTEADKSRLGITSKAEAAQHRIAKLVLPVTFPVVRMRRRR